MKTLTKLLTLCCVLCLPAAAAETGKTLEERIEALNLPGIKINARELYVDVESKVCLDMGSLELIACTKETKEHESIVAIQPKAVHVHLALLLIGARNGSPASQRMVGEEGNQRIQFIPAHGQPVEVSLVLAGKDGKQQVRPIADFIQHTTGEDIYAAHGKPEAEPEPFPTSTFLFLGSRLITQGEGPRRYLAEDSGNVITISTFGDEVLGLPMEFGHDNSSLMWEVKPDMLPAAETKVWLRLKPVFRPAPAKESASGPVEKK